MRAKLEPALRQLRTLLIKNWWIKLHHGYSGIAVELFFPIITTLLVAAFFLLMAQRIEDYSATPGPTLSEFTAYEECVSRSPLNITNRPSLSNTTYEQWTDKCVVGIAARFTNPDYPSASELDFYDRLLPYITSNLKVPHVLFDNETIMLQEADKYTLWAAISIFTNDSIVTPTSDLPYAIHISSSLLPAAVYPSSQPNVFFSLSTDFLVRGARKFSLSGFSYLQSVIEPALLNFKLQELGIHVNTTSNSDKVSVTTWNAIYQSITSSVPLVILLSASLLQIAYIPTILFAAFDLVSERRSIPYLKAMGMPETLYRLCWLIYIMFSTLLTSVIIYTISASLGVLNGIAGQSLVVILLYSMSLTALVLLISALSRSKQAAAVFILTVIAFVPNSLAIFLTNSSFFAKALCSLFSPVAFVFSLVECFKSHLVHVNQLAIIPDGLHALGRYSLPFGVTMLILDTVIYLVLAWYFHNIYTNAENRSPLFCCSPAYWRRVDETKPNFEPLSPEISSNLEHVGLSTPPSSPAPSLVPLSSSGAYSKSLDSIVRSSTPTTSDEIASFGSRPGAGGAAAAGETRITITPSIARLEAPVTPRGGRSMSQTLKLAREGTYFEPLSLDVSDDSIRKEREERVKRTMIDEVERLGSFLQAQDPRRREPGENTEEAEFGVGVRMVEVNKIYEADKTISEEQDVHAVKDVSFEALRNEIFVLVGDRGSGKTSIGRMIAGLTPITSGTIEMEGYNIRHFKHQVRSMLSVCSQENMLLNDLSVEQHLKLASRLKRMPESSEARRMEMLMTSLNLLSIRKKSVGDCTPSEKKRVSIGAAFASDSKVVILDEPTAGLDPQSRQAIWKCIIAHKKGRTVIVTTHLMAEADALADRMALMRQGSIIACGSPVFLKRRFGVGYYLNITKAATTDAKPISQFVQQRLPSAKYVILYPPSRTTVRFSLPFSDQASYPDLFQDLETQIDAHSSLGIEAYSVSLTTLEEVFDQQVHKDQLKEWKRSSRANLALDESGNLTSSTDGIDITALNPKDFLPTAKSHRSPTIWQQILLLTRMRTKMVLRDLPSLLFLLIAPLIAVVLIWLAMVFGSGYLQLPQLLNGSLTVATGETVDLTFPTVLPLLLPYVAQIPSNPDDYRNSDGFASTASFWSRAIEDRSLFDSRHFDTHSDLSHFLWQDDNPGHRFTSWVIQSWNTTTASHHVGILYNKSESYSLPIAHNLLTNSLLASYLDKHLALGNVSLEKMMQTIKLRMEPLKPIKNLLSSHNFDTTLLSSFTLFDVVFSLGLASCLAILLALITQERVRERVTKLKLQQMLMGASVDVYWCTVMMVDVGRLVLVFMLIGLTGGLIFRFELLHGMYLGAFAILALVWVPAALCMAYFVSRFFAVPKSCYKWILLLYWAMYITNYVVMFAVQISKLVRLRALDNGHTALGEFLLNYFSFFTPFSTLSSAMFDLSNVQKDFALRQVAPSFAHLMSWGRIGRHLCFLILHAIFWAILLFASAHLDTRPSAIKTSRTAKSLAADKELQLQETSDKSEEQDEAVAVEEDIDIKRMRQRIIGGEYQNSVVRVEDISMDVPKYTWWRTLGHFFTSPRTQHFKDISEQEAELRTTLDTWNHTNEAHIIDSTYFVVQPGECFGVLGPEGSGKSTLISLLIGEQHPSSGNVSINGVKLYSNHRSHFYHNALISCSPEGNFLPIFDNLSLLENLQLFISLRNQLQSHELNAITTYAITKLDLKPYMNVRCKTLNWQIKRRLCLAIALFSGNSVAFLDNPTANLDMSSKIKLWRTIQHVQQDTGLSVVLTTDSIFETNTICNHFGIFVKGKFQAMGSKEYLKNRFEEGYHLKVRLRDPEDENGGADHVTSNGDMVQIQLDGDTTRMRLEELDRFVKDNFSNSRRLTAYGRERAYFLGVLESLAWSFDLIETNKEVLRIEEYALTQTTLTDVFTQFARNQEIPT